MNVAYAITLVLSDFDIVLLCYVLLIITAS